MRAILFFVAGAAIGAPIVKWGNLPLSFEPNEGQASAEVRYLARGSSYSLYLAPGETVFAGHGAGGNPTAVAVVSDLISILRSRQVSGLALEEAGVQELPVSADFTTRHYLRFVVKDEPGIIASLALILCRAGINIDSVFQRPGFPKDKLPFVITLEPCAASQVKEALEHIAKLEFLVQPCLALPVLN